MSKSRSSITGKVSRLALLSACAGLLAACGGGGGGGSDEVPAPAAPAAPAATPTASLGTITAKGSIFINGVEFETEGAVFERENEAPEVIGPDDSKLKVGMIVEVEGEINDDGRTGKAARIRFEDSVEGPISAVVTSSSGLAKTVTILNQTVIVEDGVTAFDNADPAFDTFAELGADDVGKVIEVSGFLQDDGSFKATFIQKKADSLAAFLLNPANVLEVKGTVDAVAGSTFTLNGLTVDFTGVTPRNGTVAPGVLVEAKGRLFDPVANRLTASDVEVKVEGLDDIQKAEVEGLIANLNTAARTFTISGQPVSYAGAAFVGGTEDDLANGLRVEAEGPISGGSLQAVKIAFEESVRIETNAVVEAGVLTLAGLSGITVTVDEAITRGVADLADVATGNEIKVRARPTGSASLVATRLEIVSVQAANRATLQGPVSSFNAVAGTVTILGVTVNTATIGANDFKDHDTVIGRAAFFAALQAGTLVKARLDLTSGTWNQIELQD